MDAHSYPRAADRHSSSDTRAHTHTNPGPDTHARSNADNRPGPGLHIHRRAV